MNNKKEGNIKSTKLNSLWNRIGKKVSAGVVGLGLVVGTVFGFVGCTNNPTPTPPGPGPTPPPIVVVDEMKFDEFIAEHLEDAKGFINEFVRPEVVEEKEVKSETWSIGANSENTKIDKVSILYTYNVNETDRAVELANVSIDPVSINKIVDGEVSKSDVKLTVDRKTVFEFDAKDNYDNQEITNALYASENKTSDLKLISEAEASDSTVVAYNYTIVKDGKVDTFKIEVLKGKGSAADIIRNFKNGNTSGSTNTGSYSMNGTNVLSSGYTYENIETEKPGPGPEIPPEIVTVTDAEILNVLNEKVTMEAAKNVLNASWDVNETNVKDATWYVTKDGDNVTGANLVFNYIRRDTAHYITLCQVDFASPITPQNIKDGNVGTPTYTQLYTKSINPTIQVEHAQLADAIGDKLFGVNAGATRYIIDNGNNDLDELGNVSRFTVIEVSDNGIKENSIKIVYANSDEGLISNLADTTKFAIYGEEKSVDITGEHIAEQKLEETKTYKTSKESVKTYFGDEDFADDDLTM